LKTQNCERSENNARSDIAECLISYSRFGLSSRPQIEWGFQTEIPTFGLMVAVLAKVEWEIWQNPHLFSPNSATLKVEKHFLLAEVENKSRK